MYKIKNYISVLLFLVFAIFPLISFAARGGSASGSPSTSTTPIAGEDEEITGGGTGITPLSFFDDCKDVEGGDVLGCWVKSAYTFALGAIGFLAFLVIVVAGIIYMSSTGNQERVAKAKQYLKGAFLGVALLILAGLLISLAEDIFGWDGLIF